jgi:Fe-S-cluster containining protein
MRDDWSGEYPPDDEAEWLLNKGGACVFFKEGIGCTIHATRPMVCRLFNCDAKA